jgi:tRNA1(Val) A37 N6-methylase TrmN6
VTEDEFQEFALAFASAVVKPGGNAAYVLPNTRLETLLAEDG